MNAAAVSRRRWRRTARRFYVGFVTLVYAFLLLPLVIVVLASFNSGEFLTFPPEGFSLKWYVSFFNADAFVNSLFYSLRLAFLCTLVSTLLGTCIALYVVRHAGRWREHLRLFILLPLLLPEILTAIALLFFYYNFDALMRELGLTGLVGLFRNSMLGLLIGHVAHHASLRLSRHLVFALQFRPDPRRGCPEPWGKSVARLRTRDPSDHQARDHRGCVALLHHFVRSLRHFPLAEGDWHRHPANPAL